MNYEDMLPYYYYVFNDNWLIFQDDADGETESTKVLPAHSFFLSGRDILPENCIPVTLKDWQTATENPNREYEELYNYADESIVICTEYHEDSGIGKRVSIIHNGKGMVIPRTNQTYTPPQKNNLKSSRTWPKNSASTHRPPEPYLKEEVFR